MSRFANYQALVDEIRVEVGWGDDSERDALILSLLKRVVDGLNYIDGDWREEIKYIPLTPGQYRYALPDDYQDVLDPMTSLYYRENDETYHIPIEKDRHVFASGWNVAERGEPGMARIIRQELQFKPTPSSAFTVYMEYYKRLATPTLAGTVLIPDEVIALVRDTTMVRLAMYKDDPSKANALLGLSAPILQEIKNRAMLRRLPTSVVQSEDTL